MMAGQESSPGHVGVKQVLSPLRQACSPPSNSILLEDLAKIYFLWFTLFPLMLSIIIITTIIIYYFAPITCYFMQEITLFISNFAD